MGRAKKKKFIQPTQEVIHKSEIGNVKLIAFGNATGGLAFPLQKFSQITLQGNSKKICNFIQFDNHKEKIYGKERLYNNGHD